MFNKLKVLFNPMVCIRCRKSFRRPKIETAMNFKVWICPHCGCDVAKLLEERKLI